MTPTNILAQHVAQLFTPVPSPLGFWAEPMTTVPATAGVTETVFSTAELLPAVNFVPRAASLVERAVMAARVQVGENAAARQVTALCWSTNWPLGR